MNEQFGSSERSQLNRLQNDIVWILVGVLVAMKDENKKLENSVYLTRMR